jgi:hypothetical protein
MVFDRRSPRAIYRDKTSAVHVPMRATAQWAAAKACGGRRLRRGQLSLNA